MYDRLKVYPAIVLLCIIPTYVFVTCLAAGYDSDWMFCLVGVAVSSSGTLAVTFLFWAPYIDKLRRNNISFALDMMLETSFFSRRPQEQTEMTQDFVSPSSMSS